MLLTWEKEFLNTGTCACSLLDTEFEICMYSAYWEIIAIISAHVQCILRLKRLIYLHMYSINWDLQVHCILRDRYLQGQCSCVYYLDCRSVMQHMTETGQNKSRQVCVFQLNVSLRERERERERESTKSYHLQVQWNQ